jgi:two-component system cell cycle sensor histidine kinase/response regulator CckA
MGKVVGVVEVQSYERSAYTAEHATAMRMAANLTANAIENVRLFEAEQARAEQLRQSQKLESVGRLAGGIAHDFNNMLTAINGFSDLTLRKLPEGDPLRANLLEIRKAGSRSAELTQQLLAFSRRQMLHPRVIDLNQTVNDTKVLLERLIGEDIEVSLALSPDIGSVQADPGQITQVIMNLAVNSRDAMPDGGKITIETANQDLDQDYMAGHAEMPAGSYVMLAVSDNGSGMSPEVQKHLFEPFFTTKPTGHGTGLGLATVYGIVKQSGGYIWAYSELGQGAVIKVYLPRLEAEIDKVPAANISTEDLRGDETILLVEDEDIVRRLARKILETCGYTVIEAADGAEGVEICKNTGQQIDLLLTDVVMPKMSGRQLVQNVAAIRPELKILFMSGYTDDSIVRHGAIKSGENFIQKPFTFNALAGKIRAVLDQGKIHQSDAAGTS